MNTELRKRLEEAAEKTLNCTRCSAPKSGECKYRAECHSYQTYIKGAEHGYKEAIALAKEWLMEHTVTRMPEEDDKDFVWVESDRYEDKDEFIARFESDMNKLWEEKK